MVSADKLIKVGVRYSDKYFETLKNIYNNAYRNNDSLEDFLNETKDYSIGNPLEAGGFKEQLTNLVVASTNDIRFSRPAQKALMNTIISNTTGELITNVGDDIKAGVRDIVSRGYREGKLNHNRVADEINSKLDGINRKRARTIARTEIKRAQTTSNYVVARERGANAYTYKCGAKPCDICIEDCGETFPIDDLEHLPPRHPNCMCGVSFFKDPTLPEASTLELTQEEFDRLVNPENSRSNIQLTKGQLKPVIEHQGKYKDSLVEYGNLLKLESKEMHFETDVQGTTNRIHFKTIPREPHMMIHNHPDTSGFSGIDMSELLRAPNQLICTATTKDDVWIAKLTKTGYEVKTNFGGIPEVMYKDVKTKMDDKAIEISSDVYESKYRKLIEESTSGTEIQRLTQEYRKTWWEEYNQWILKEYGVGQESQLFEINRIPIKELENVK